MLDRHINASSTFGVNVREKEVIFEKKAETNLTASLNFYTNNLYDEKASSPLQVMHMALWSEWTLMVFMVALVNFILNVLS